MLKSTTSTKPDKPRADWPMFAHASGRWCRKKFGRFYYFGKWDDVEGADKKYKHDWPYIVEGRTPPPMPCEDDDDETGEFYHDPRKDGPLTIKKLCNIFLWSKGNSVITGDLSPLTARDYQRTTERVVDFFGKRTIVEHLMPSDFERFRVSIAKGRGPVALGNEIQRVRTVFKFAHDMGYVEIPAKLAAFKKPTRSKVRLARAAKQNMHGKRMFMAEEIHRILKAANPQMKAMVLLAINGGFGQTDLAHLPQSLIEGEWLSYPRVKNGAERKCWLWPETLSAIETYLPNRPIPAKPEDSRLLFLTEFGNRWVKVAEDGSHNDALGQQFSKLLRKLGIKRVGLSFYALRHTHATIASGATDQVASDLIMGHLGSDMASLYREVIEDSRVRRVCEHVRLWLFGESP